MDLILLVGVLLNYYGAVRILMSAIAVLPDSASLPAEFLQFKLFSAGVAAVFGSLYLYLYFRPEFAVPFLMFGAALKTWAFALSLFLHSTHRQDRSSFIEFGISNGIVAVLFWYYIVSIV